LRGEEEEKEKEKDIQTKQSNEKDFLPDLKKNTPEIQPKYDRIFFKSVSKPKYKFKKKSKKKHPLPKSISIKMKSSAFPLLRGSSKKYVVGSKIKISRKSGFYVGLSFPSGVGSSRISVLYFIVREI
jgi:hypothetical protein